METATPFLKPEQVARLLSVSTRTLRNWRRNGGGPPWIRVGPQLVRYPLEGFAEWAAERGYKTPRGS